QVAALLDSVVWYGVYTASQRYFDMKKNSPAWLLGGGMAAAIGASLCCAGPFVLLLLGVSGSWISTLTAFEPFRPYFIAVVVVLYLWAGWRVHRPIERCPEGSVCALPK